MSPAAFSTVTVTARDPAGPEQGPDLDRLPRLVGFDGAADGALARALSGLSVLVVGAGSIGARIADGLGRTGVGVLGLADPKVFSPGFQTQAIRGAGDVGQPKAATVARWVAEVAPAGTTLRVLDDAIQAVPWMELDDFDIVVGATDLLGAEVWLGQRTRWLGKPLVLAAVSGETLTAQVRTFMNRDETSPCPACDFNSAEWAQLDGERRFSCDGTGSTVSGPPTVSVAPLCGLAADLAALTVLRLALRLGRPARDGVLELCAYTNAAVFSPRLVRAECNCDHGILERALLDRPLRECTLRHCAAAAGLAGEEALERASFEVDDLGFCTMAACRACGSPSACGRFVDRGGAVPGPCAACGAAELAAHSFHTVQGPVPAGAGLVSLLDRALGDLGAPGVGVVVRHGRRAVLVRQGRERP